MDEALVERWLRRRLRIERFSILVLALVLALGSFVAFNVTFMIIYVPVALISLGLGIHPGIGANLVLIGLIVGYFCVRKRRKLPLPEVTTMADSGEAAMVMPEEREHWLRVRSSNQRDPFTLRSMCFDLVFMTPSLAESAFSVLVHRAKLGRIDVTSCARAIAIIARELHKMPFAKLQAALPGEDMARLLLDLWLLEEVQFVTAPPQGVIVTEEARKQPDGLEDPAFIAAVSV